MVSGQSFGSSVVSLACISSMCSVQCFPGGHSLCFAFGSFFYRRMLAVFCSSFKPFFFLPCLRLRLVFCAIVVSSYFGATILSGRSSLRLAMVFCLGVSSAISWFESSTTASLRFFSRDGSTVVLHSLASQSSGSRT